MCNKQAATWIKDTLWGPCLQAGEEQTQTALLMLSILKLRAKTWQETPQACKYELDLSGVIRPAVPRQIPFHLLGRPRNHRSHSWPLLATQRAWNLILTDQDFPWSWDQQLQAPTSHSKLPENFREKEGRQDKQDWGVVPWVDTVTPWFRGFSVTTKCCFLDKGVVPIWKVRGNNAWKLWNHFWKDNQVQRSK